MSMVSQNPTKLMCEIQLYHLNVIWSRCISFHCYGTPIDKSMSSLQQTFLTRTQGWVFRSLCGKAMNERIDEILTNVENNKKRWWKEKKWRFRDDINGMVEDRKSEYGTEDKCSVYQVYVSYHIKERNGLNRGIRQL